MRLLQGIRLGAWLLIGLNLVMGFGSIWIFIRMAPAIEIIIEQNERSLHACEEMLATLVLQQGVAPENAHIRAQFRAALNRARDNVTEPDEPMALDAIAHSYEQAFAANPVALEETVRSIRQLREINRRAMVRADQRARQLGTAGAWGIVFMASFVFLVGLIFLRRLRENLVAPLGEIHNVLHAVKHGDHLRRCSGPKQPNEIKYIFREINDLLDQQQATESDEFNLNAPG